MIKHRDTIDRVPAPTLIFEGKEGLKKRANITTRVVLWSSGIAAVVAAVCVLFVVRPPHAIHLSMLPVVDTVEVLCYREPIIDTTLHQDRVHKVVASPQSLAPAPTIDNSASVKEDTLTPVLHRAEIQTVNPQFRTVLAQFASPVVAIEHRSPTITTQRSRPRLTLFGIRHNKGNKEPAENDDTRIKLRDMPREILESYISNFRHTANNR